MKFEKVPVSSFAEVITGGTPSTSVKEYWDNGNIPWLHSGELNKGIINESSNFITEAGLKGSSARMMPPGTVLIALTGATTGLTALLNIDACANQSVTGILPSDHHDAKYLYYYFKTQRHQILKKAWGGAQPHINQQFVKNYIVPLPSIEDQRRIANIFSKAESLIDQRKESIRLLDEFLKSTFMEMFGDVINNTRNLKIEKLGKYITHLTSGGRNWNKYYSNNGKRFIRSFDVQMNSISDEDIVLVNPPNNQEAKRTNVQGNDVLLTITGSRIGRVAYIPNDFGEAYVSQHVAIIRTQKISPLYLSYYLSMENCGQYLIRNSHYGQTKPGLNFDQIRSFDIIIPSSRHQDQFCQIVANVDRLRARYKESLREYENLYGSLVQRTFKGELQFNSDSRAVSLQTAEREVDYFKKRKALACYIINQSLDDDKFGDTKFEKLLFLSDYSAVKRNLGQHYYQKVAGPYDNTFTTTFYIQIENSELFKRKRGNRQTIFLAGANHIKSFNANDYFSEEELKRVNSLIKIFRKSDYEQPEIIATLYAVWNNRIIRQQEITDELLKEDFLRWDARKSKYKDRLSKALSWMRAQSIVPDGWGRIIDPPKGSKTKTKSKSRD